MIIFHKIRRVFSAFYSEFPFFALGSDFTLCPAWFSDISVARAPRPIVRLHRTASFAVTPQLSLRGPILFCLARKSRQKDALDELLFSRLLSVPKNVLHADAGRLHLFRFCSFPEYSADYDITQHVVGADVGIGPYKDSQ